MKFLIRVPGDFDLLLGALCFTLARLFLLLNHNSMNSKIEWLKARNEWLEAGNEWLEAELEWPDQTTFNQDLEILRCLRPKVEREWLIHALHDQDLEILRCFRLGGLTG